MKKMLLAALLLKSSIAMADVDAACMHGARTVATFCGQAAFPYVKDPMDEKFAIQICVAAGQQAYELCTVPGGLDKYETSDISKVCGLYSDFIRDDIMTVGKKEVDKSPSTMRDWATQMVENIAMDASTKALLRCDQNIEK